jgi:hypothetical protein
VVEGIGYLTGARPFEDTEDVFAREIDLDCLELDDNFPGKMEGGGEFGLRAELRFFSFCGRRNALGSGGGRRRRGRRRGSYSLSGSSGSLGRGSSRGEGRFRFGLGLAGDGIRYPVNPR